ncbi:MAG: phytanoyl-CoA dioxygenase family protein [Myxococcota bacterium]|nr:phytanoyl-CoA dioxygenase family protein [Myxococcota bacterium]
MLTEEDRLLWEQQGLLHLPGFFPGAELQHWTDELALWPETPGRWMKYFEDIQGARELCRVENFLHYHGGWKSVIEHPVMSGVLETLFGEPRVLFKEKINFKLPGGSGFGAHQDAPAFATFGQQFHITAMVSIDATTRANGCLEVAYGRHREGLLGMTESQVLTEDVVNDLEWVPLETSPGDLVLFGSYLPHRSGPNTSSSARRAAYLTFNPRRAGSCREKYYEDKRRVFPPEVERVPGRDYSDSGLYNIGNPIQE